jgi:hypothetical protein
MIVNNPNLAKISNLFDVVYGVNLELVNLIQCKSADLNSMPFVSRTENNNGVSAYVEQEQDVNPNPGHTLSVAGGGSVLATFYQPFPYYSGRDLYVLVPKKKMSIIEMLFYAKCISTNKYKYNYGRQANKTLKNILIPAKMPTKLNNHLVLYLKKLLKDISIDSVINKKIDLKIDKWEYCDLQDLFNVSSSKDELIYKLSAGGKTPYVASSENNNGVIEFVDEEPSNKANTITANRGGSVGHFFYQPVDYLATPVDVRILTPKFKMNKYVGLFFAALLRLEKFRFNYSRKMGTDRLKKLKIKIPVKNNNLDIELMENYIKSLPYSKSI